MVSTWLLNFNKEETSVSASDKSSGLMTCEPLKRAALNRSAKCSLFFQKFFRMVSGFKLLYVVVFKSSRSCVMGKLHRVRIIRRKTGNIPGERYAWIKFTINDKEKQEMRLFVYRILRIRWFSELFPTNWHLPLYALQCDSKVMFKTYIQNTI